MIDSHLLKRVGLWTLSGAAFVGLVLPRLTAESLDIQVAKHAAAAGLAAVALGFLIENAGRRKPCRRCGQRSVTGSVFCARHRHELALATGQVSTQHGRDQRQW